MFEKDISNIFINQKKIKDKLKFKTTYGDSKVTSAADSAQNGRRLIPKVIFYSLLEISGEQGRGSTIT